jgi:hypothetical protein
MNCSIVRRGLTVSHWLLALAPLILWVGLLGMFERATRILGKFPKPSIDDPYHLMTPITPITYHLSPLSIDDPLMTPINLGSQISSTQLGSARQRLGRGW